MLVKPKQPPAPVKPSSRPDIFPAADPLLRLPDVLSWVPVSRSTWWSWVASGKAPKGIKMSAKTTAWRRSAIQGFIDNLEETRGG